MFSREPDASKLALAAMVAWLRRHGSRVIDCQQRTQHLASLGGREIDRKTFEHAVHELAQAPELPWAETPVCKEDLREFAA
jgi:leucyl/phenylalanyl-tRNA--protein transferase